MPWTMDLQSLMSGDADVVGCAAARPASRKACCTRWPVTWCSLPPHSSTPSTTRWTMSTGARQTSAGSLVTATWCTVRWPTAPQASWLVGCSACLVFGSVCLRCLQDMFVFAPVILAWCVSYDVVVCFDEGKSGKFIILRCSGTVSFSGPSCSIQVIR